MYGLTIDRTASLSIARQLYRQIRQKILAGQLQEGNRLPATRTLANQLGIARNTVVEVYEQLKIEGFFISHPGSYTTVAPNACLTRVPPMRPMVVQDQTTTGSDLIDFRPGIPALDLFPRKVWQKSVSQVVTDIPATYFGYHTAAGCRELRSAIASYLFATRGILAAPEEIIITAGSTQAFYLVVRLLCSENRNVFLADPVNHDVRQFLTALGCDLAAVPIDDQGMRTDLLPELMETPPAFTLVTPSQQFPTGGILPIQRRIQLIQLPETRNRIWSKTTMKMNLPHKKARFPPYRNWTRRK